nr:MULTISPECIES: hypothetical protein [Pseudomonas]
MELKQFVTAVLTEILDGVKDSQRAIEHAREGEVNPQLATNQGALQNQGRLVSRWGQLVQTVKFDVAVTVEEGTGTKGGIGIFIGAVGLGSQGESKTSQASVSRIQFEVPVALPYQEPKT